MADLGEGVVFAGHRIEGVAGRGGMGTVYRATHLALDHMVALKVIAADLAGDDSFRERFKSESRIAVSLRHPNVVPIHHAGEEDGLLFVTMDLIDGPDLRGLLIERQELDPEPAIAILEQVAAALDVAHSRGLVHRDIKPGNILIEDRAGSDHAYLTDFGLTKRMDQASGATALTSTGAFVGTLDYVAPEQIRGDDLDARTDVYALGCVLYEMLAGCAPFSDREEKVAKMYAHLQDGPERLTGDRAPFNDVVDRALAKQPDDRFPSAGDLARAAAAALGGGAVVEAERSVATGPAAPTQVHESGLAAAGAAAGAAPAGEPAATEASSGPTGEPTLEEQPSFAEPTVESSTPPGPDAPPGPGPAPGAETGTETAAGSSGRAARAGSKTGPAASVAERPAGRRRSPVPLVVGMLALAALIGGGVLVLGGSEDAPQPQTTTANGNGEPGPQGEVVGDAEVPGFTFGISFDGQGNELVVGTRDGELFNVDRQGDVSSGVSPTGSRLEDVVVADGSTYVAAPEEGAVFRIGADETSVPVPVGTAPQGLAAGNGAVWVANSGASSISRIALGEDTSTPIELENASKPHGIAVSKDAIWVTSRETDRAIRVAIDGSGSTGEQLPQTVGDNPKGIAIAGGAVWVANTGDGTISRLDPTSGKPRGPALEVGGEPRDVISAFGRVWVSDGKRGRVIVLDPSDGTELGSIDVGGSPEELAAGGGSVWVTTGEDGRDNVVEIEPG